MTDHPNRIAQVADRLQILGFRLSIQTNYCVKNRDDMAVLYSSLEDVEAAFFPLGIAVQDGVGTQESLG